LLLFSDAALDTEEGLSSIFFSPLPEMFVIVAVVDVNSFIAPLIPFVSEAAAFETGGAALR
jgi:hypothetical protein